MIREVEVVSKPKSWLIPPRQRRSVFDPVKQRQLRESIEAIGLINPIECPSTGEIISGDRRASAILESESIQEVAVRIITNPLTARDIRIRRLSENLQRVDVRFWDKYRECKGFIEDEPGITLKEIAAAIHVEASTVTRYLSPDRCIEPVRRAAEDGLIGMKDCYGVSLLPQDQQAERLAKLLRKKGRGSVLPDGTVPAARPGKLKLPLPSGFTVVIGQESGAVTVKDAIRELTAALEVLRDAEKEGLGQKAVAAVCQDKAARRTRARKAEATA